MGDMDQQELMIFGDNRHDDSSFMNSGIIDLLENGENESTEFHPNMQILPADPGEETSRSRIKHSIQGKKSLSKKRHSQNPRGRPMGSTITDVLTGIVQKQRESGKISQRLVSMGEGAKKVTGVGKEGEAGANGGVGSGVRGAINPMIGGLGTDRNDKKGMPLLDSKLRQKFIQSATLSSVLAQTLEDPSGPKANLGQPVQGPIGLRNKENTVGIVRRPSSRHSSSQTKQEGNSNTLRRIIPQTLDVLIKNRASGDK